MSLNQKIFHFFNRHPFFYKMRFIIISRKSKNNNSFQDFNKSEEVPCLFKQMNKIIPIRIGVSELEKAKDIARWIVQNMKGGRGLGLDSETTLKTMLATKAGVCSDYSQLFNIFCLINDIEVREWGSMRKDSFIGGHSFNEIFDKTLNKWVLIDVSKLLVFESDVGNVKSVEEVFTTETLSYPVIFGLLNGPVKNLGVFDPDSYKPFIIGNYHNLKVDQVLRHTKSLPASIRHFLLILTGRMYRFYFQD